LRQRRQGTDGRRGQVFSFPVQLQFDARRDIGRAVGVAGTGALADLDDFERARLATGVDELDEVPDPDLGQQLALDRDDGSRPRQIFPWAFLDQPDHCRRRDLAQRIARRTPLDHALAGRDRPGPELGSRQVEGNLARQAEFLFRGAQMFDYPRPDLLIVVGTVDAHDVHALRQQIGDERGIVGRLARHGDHHPRLAVSGCRAEDRCGMFRQDRFAAIESDRGRFFRLLRHRLPVDQVQGAQHVGKRGHDMRLGAPQRTESQLAQLTLQIAIVALPHGQVMHQVAGAVPQRGRDFLQRFGKLALQQQRFLAQPLDKLDGLPDAGCARCCFSG